MFTVLQGRGRAGLRKDAQGLICYKVKLRRYNKKTGAKVQERFLPSPQEAFTQFSLGWISQDSFLITNLIDISPSSDWIIRNWPLNYLSS